MRLPDAIADRIVPRLLERAKRQPLTYKVVVDHEIIGVTPEMITWWWSNIKDTECYRKWCPKDHVSFQWEVPPEGNHIGAIQIVREYIGSIPATIRILFDDPSGIRSDFDYILLGKVLSENNNVIVQFTHEYKPIRNGTRMCSTFLLPRLLYPLMGKGLRQHNIEEMAGLSDFLPGLYLAEK